MFRWKAQPIGTWTVSGWRSRRVSATSSSPWAGPKASSISANLYHNAGKPMVPLNLPICSEFEGSRKLYQFRAGQPSDAPTVPVADDVDAHDWLNRIDFRQTSPSLTGSLIWFWLSRGPRSPQKRLRCGCSIPTHPDSGCARTSSPVWSNPCWRGNWAIGSSSWTGARPLEHARLDQEIFAKLHRSSFVIADITGLRPNCFVELGYALGRSLPTMIWRAGGERTSLRYHTLSGLHWNPSRGTLEDAVAQVPGALDGHPQPAAFGSDEALI